MKTFFTFLSIAFGVITTFGQINQTDAKGQKQGQWIKAYPNSKIIQYQGTFKNDKPVGTFTYKYPSNKIKAIVKHNENGTRSVAEFYHENGLIMTKGIYRNLKKDSIWVSYNEDGRITMTETFKNDELNGIKNLYYLPSDPQDKSQIVISSYNYVDGKVDGKFTEWYPTKTVRKTGQFKNFQRHGEWIEYELDGKKMSVTHYQNGKLHGWSIGYNKDGSEGQRRYFQYGRQVQGEELTKLLKYMKEKGINPNGKD